MPKVRPIVLIPVLSRLGHTDEPAWIEGQETSAWKSPNSLQLTPQIGSCLNTPGASRSHLQPPNLGQADAA